MLSPLLQRLQDTLENPGLYRPLTAEEQAELFLTLFAPKAKRKVKVVQGIDGKTPEKDKDYLSKETSEQLIADLASKTKAELEALVATKLANVANGKDGKDAEITPELISEIAQMAQSMIVLPDFPTLITMEPEAIRNALELLPDGEKLVQEAIEGLPEDLEDIRRRLDKSQNIIAAGVTQAGVLRLIEENATALPVGGTTGQVLAKASDADGDAEWVSPGAGATAWGDITGTLADQTDLQTALNGKAATSHTHAIADVTGLQTALDGKAATLGADDNYVTDAEKVKLSNLSGTNTGDQNLAPYLLSATAATTYEPIKGADDNFVTDAEKVKLANLSGTNSGDQTSIVGITGTKAQFDTAVTDGNFMYVGDAPTAHTHTASAITDFDTEVSNNTDVAANTTARHTHSNKATLDLITAAFTTADETKLDGIETAADVTDATNVAAAGAIMDGDFTTNGLMKRTGAGTYATAVAGTDYVAPDQQLTDIAALSYTGNATKVVRVNAGETAFELVTLAGGGDALVANPLSQFAATTSAQLKGVISDETGGGALVFADAPTLNDVVLGAGDATTAPLQLTSGTLQTTPSDGAIEMDGDCFYATTDGGNRGVIPVEHIIRADATRTFTSDTLQQRIFTTPANGTLTLETGTYLFEGLIAMTSMSASSGNGKFSLIGAGTATLGSILWQAYGNDNASQTTGAATGGMWSVIATQTATNIVTAGTGTAMAFMVKGTFEVTGAGTIIPSFAQTTAAAAVVSIGSYIKFNRIGSTTMTSVGQWT